MGYLFGCITFYFFSELGPNLRSSIAKFKKIDRKKEGQLMSDGDFSRGDIGQKIG
jgi:hypothetical protein